MKATSKVCVCNAGSFPELPLRKSQFQINTHHGGGAYKTAGAAIKGANSKTNLKKLQWDAEIPAYISLVADISLKRSSESKSVLLARFMNMVCREMMSS